MICTPFLSAKNVDNHLLSWGPKTLLYAEWEGYVDHKLKPFWVLGTLFTFFPFCPFGWFKFLIYITSAELSRQSTAPLWLEQITQDGPGSVRLRFGHGAVPAVPVFRSFWRFFWGTGFLCVSVRLEGESTVPVSVPQMVPTVLFPVSVPGKKSSDGSHSDGCGSVPEPPWLQQTGLLGGLLCCEEAKLSRNFKLLTGDLRSSQGKQKILPISPFFASTSPVRYLPTPPPYLPWNAEPPQLGTTQCLRSYFDGSLLNKL